MAENEDSFRSFCSGFYRAMGATQIDESPSKPEGRLLPVFEWQLENTKPNKIR